MAAAKVVASMMAVGAAKVNETKVVAAAKVASAKLVAGNWWSGSGGSSSDSCWY